MGIDPISALYRGGFHLIQALPRPLAEIGGRIGGRGVAEWSTERRLLVERNLRRVYGEDYGGRALRRSVHRTFSSYARYWVDSFRLPGMDAAELDAGFDCVGIGHVMEARAQGKGPILVLPHVGGWEWGGMWLARILKVPVTAVVESVEPQELFDFFMEFRRALGVEVIPLTPTAGSEVLRAVKAGRVVCLLADRDIQGDGIPVTFFGEQTTMPAGPATLALRTGSPLLPAAIYFAPHGHRAVIEGPMPVERRGRLREDVARVTQDIADRLEGLIRAAPEQWHLQQPNWPSDYAALEAIGKPYPTPDRTGH